MTTDEIIQAFQKVKAEDPKTYYNAMGAGDDGINIMHPFIGDSYALGLVAGAKYALEHFTSGTPKDGLIKDHVIYRACHMQYYGIDGYNPCDFCDKTIRRRCKPELIGRAPCDMFTTSRTITFFKKHNK